MCCPSATFAVWSSAWLRGAAAADDILDAVSTWGERHEVVAADTRAAEAFDLPWSEDPPTTPAHLLVGLRKAGIQSVQLTLPVPGDVRGLSGGGPFTEAAVHSGEAALLRTREGTLSYGLVPHRIATGIVRWTLHAPEAGIADDYVGFKDAERQLNAALRESAETLQALEVARDRPEARTELALHLRSMPHLDWPAGMPAPTLRVLQRANEIAAILLLATEDEPGGAVSASAAQLRSTTLRTLDNAVRIARRAAINEAVRIFAG